MKINVGSQNKTKLAAVQDVVNLYPDFFKDTEINGMAVEIEEFAHPKNIKDTVAGAIERAKKAYSDCEYSIGLEGGLIEVPFSKTGFMEVGACAIYDGKNCHIGLSPAFELPKKVTELIISDEADASQAFKKLGLTEHEKLGAVDGGIVGFLSKGRLTREELTKQSIIMALIQLEHPELY